MNLPCKNPRLFLWMCCTTFQFLTSFQTICYSPCHSFLVSKAITCHFNTISFQKLYSIGIKPLKTNLSILFFVWRWKEIITGSLKILYQPWDQKGKKKHISELIRPIYMAKFLNRSQTKMASHTHTTHISPPTSPPAEPTIVTISELAGEKIVFRSWYP